MRIRRRRVRLSEGPNPMKRSVVVASFVVTMLAAVAADAQEYMPAGSVHVASGAEGAGGDLHRARTRLRVALDLRVDEAPNDGVVVAGLVDLEPRAAFGAELRYVHAISPRFTIGAGAIGYAAPATLLGPSAGLEANVPIAKKTFFVVGPETAVFVVGSDLPNNTVVWQALLQVGFRANF